MSTYVPPTPTALEGLSPPPRPAPPPAPPATSWLPQVRAPRRTLVAALLLGVLAEVLLNRPRWGVSFPLTVVALLGALAWLGGREGWQRARPNAWLVVPLVAISGFVAVRASPWLWVLDVLTVSGLLLLLAHFWAAGRVERLGVVGYPVAVLGSLLRGVCYPPALVQDSVDLGTVKAQAPRLLPFARGLLFAVPVLVVFGVLLESADAAFASALARVWSVDVGSLLGSVVARAVGALLFAFAAAGVLGHALRRRRARELGEVEVAPATPRLGLTEALTLILTVDALFLVFAGFQVVYLFIGGASEPAPGFSHAEYARRGFFELLVVSLLTLGLVMALARWTRRESPGARAAFRLGTSLMVALTLVILASAVKRLTLYEDAFGYTRLRLFTHVFMYGLGTVLAWRAVTLWWRPERFALGAFVTALGTVVAVNVINPDALIVRLNLARQAGASELDTRYLSGLSADAVPELVRGFSGSALERERTASLLNGYALEPWNQEETWPEWSLASWRARRALRDAGLLSAGGSGRAAP